MERPGHRREGSLQRGRPPQAAPASSQLRTCSSRQPSGSPPYRREAVCLKSHSPQNVHQEGPLSPGRRPARRAADVEKAVAEPVPSLVSESPCASHLSLGALFPRQERTCGAEAAALVGAVLKQPLPKHPLPAATPSLGQRAGPTRGLGIGKKCLRCTTEVPRPPATHTIVATDHTFIHSVTEAHPPQEGPSPVW